MLFAVYSYKEDSDGETDSDDLIEAPEQDGTVEVEEENPEGVERILDHREGKKGGPCWGMLLDLV